MLCTHSAVPVFIELLVYLLSSKYGSSFVPQTTFSGRRHVVIFDAKLKKLPHDEYYAQNLMKEPETSLYNEHETNRYKIRSILLQHVLTNQTKEYKKLQNRVTLLQDTVKKLVQDRRIKITPQYAKVENTNTTDTRYLEELQLELQKKEETNQLLQQKYNHLLLIGDIRKERNTNYLETLKALSDQLEKELELFSIMRTTFVPPSRDKIRSLESEVRIVINVASSLDKNEDIEVDEWDRLIQKLRIQVNTIPMERDQILYNWPNERDRIMSLDLSEEKVKSEQTLHEARESQQQSLSSLDTLSQQQSFTSLETIHSEDRFRDNSCTWDFRKNKSSVHNDSENQFHRLEHRSFFLYIWNEHVLPKLHRAIGGIKAHISKNDSNITRG